MKTNIIVTASILALCTACGSSNSKNSVGDADAAVSSTDAGSDGGATLTPAMIKDSCLKECGVCAGTAKDACSKKCNDGPAPGMADFVDLMLKKCSSACAEMPACDDLANATCNDQGVTDSKTKDTPECKAVEASCEKCMKDAMIGGSDSTFSKLCTAGCDAQTASLEKSGTCPPPKDGEDGFDMFCRAMCTGIDASMTAAKDTTCIALGETALTCTAKLDYVCTSGRVGGGLPFPKQKDPKACEAESKAWQDCADKHLKQGQYKPCKTGEKQCYNDKLMTCTNDKYDAGVACPKGTTCMGISNVWDCHKDS